MDHPTENNRKKSLLSCSKGEYVYICYHGMLLVETSSSFKEGSHGNNTSAVTSCFVVWLLRKKEKEKRGGEKKKKKRERERECV